LASKIYANCCFTYQNSTKQEIKLFFFLSVLVLQRHRHHLVYHFWWCIVDVAKRNTTAKIKNEIEKLG